MWPRRGRPLSLRGAIAPSRRRAMCGEISMSTTLTVRDETPAGGVTNEWSLEFLAETITVRDLIRERVYQEVQDHNLRQGSAPYRGLVQPEGFELTLNGPRAGGKPRPIDWRKQYEKAVEAFESNQVLILIDDRQ